MIKLSILLSSISSMEALAPDCSLPPPYHTKVSKTVLRLNYMVDIPYTSIFFPKNVANIFRVFGSLSIKRNERKPWRNDKTAAIRSWVQVAEIIFWMQGKTTCNRSNVVQPFPETPYWWELYVLGCPLSVKRNQIGHYLFSILH